MIWFVNDLALAKHLTRDQTIVIHGNPRIPLQYIGAL